MLYSIKIKHLCLQMSYTLLLKYLNALQLNQVFVIKNILDNQIYRFHEFLNSIDF